MAMTYTVPVLSIIFIVLNMIVGVALPIGMLIYFKKKHNCGVAVFFVGCAVMLLFALLLEQIAHYLVLNSPLGATIQNNVWILAIYGGLMAGLFEETGRFVAFKTVLKKYQDNNYNALMYGAGHAGFEVFMILTVSMVNYLIYAIMMNSGTIETLTATLSGDLLDQTQQVLVGLATTPPVNFLLSIVERFGAIIGHLSFSVLVFFAAKNKKYVWLYPVAILLHLLLDTVAVLLGRNGVNVVLVEVVVWVMAILFAVFAYSIWRKVKKESEVTA